MNYLIDNILQYVNGNVIIIVLYVLSLLYLTIFELKIKNKLIIPIIILSILVISLLLFNKLYAWLFLTYIIISLTYWKF